MQLLNANPGPIIAFLAIATFLILLLVGFIISFFFLYQKKQHRFLKELEFIKLNFDRELFIAQLEIQEQTFQYISQEIHDNVGQSISLAKLQLNTVNLQKPNEAIGLIDTSANLMTDVLEDLRNISKSLSTDIIKNGGLVTAIEVQVEQVKKSGVYDVIFEHTGPYPSLNEQKEIFLFRMIQESVNNIIRHANADRIEISLQNDNNQIILKIVDNGEGFNIIEAMAPGIKKTSSGLGNLKRRAKMIDSEIDIQSSPGKGTSITIVTPVN